MDHQYDISESQPIDPCWFQRPNGDLEREDARGSNFPAALRNYARTAGSKTTASEKVTHVGRFLFLGDQPPSIPRRRGSASPTFFRDVRSTSIPFELERRNSVW